MLLSLQGLVPMCGRCDAFTPVSGDCLSQRGHSLRVRSTFVWTWCENSQDSLWRWVDSWFPPAGRCVLDGQRPGHGCPSMQRLSGKAIPENSLVLAPEPPPAGVLMRSRNSSRLRTRQLRFRSTRHATLRCLKFAKFEFPPS